MLFTTALLTVVLTSSFVASARQYPTEAQVTVAHNAIVDIIESEKQTIGGDNAFPFRAGFVRLSFHDCVGVNGCDGCIDHNIVDNKGLQKYTDKLDAKYTSTSAINTTMSKADFYILAGYVALEEATKHQTNSTEKILRADHFKAGRETCSSLTTPTPGFPVGKDQLGDMDNFFSVHFSAFTITDKVAILGAHSLGRCSVENSGFEGTWVRGKSGDRFQSDILDNEYYKQLRGNWTQMTAVGGTEKQWQRFDTNPNSASDGANQPNMFLNVDMSIQWDLETDNVPLTSDGTASCTVIVERNQCVSVNDDCCDRASTNIGNAQTSLFKKYTRSNAVWIADFKLAFNKMVETRLGSSDLQFPA